MTKFDTKKEKFFKTPVPKDISVDDVKYLAGRYGCDWKDGANHSRVIFDPEKYSDCPIPYTSIQVPRHPGPVKPTYIAQLKQLFIQITDYMEENHGL